MISSLLQTCHKLLRPGGIVIGLNDNPDCDLPPDSFHEHQFTRRNVDGFVVEFKLWSVVNNEKTSIEFCNYITPKKVFHRLGKEIGFRSLELQVPLLDDAAKDVSLNFDSLISPNGAVMCIHACK